MHISYHLWRPSKLSWIAFPEVHRWPRPTKDGEAIRASRREGELTALRRLCLGLFSTPPDISIPDIVTLDKHLLYLQENIFKNLLAYRCECAPPRPECLAVSAADPEST